MYDSWHIHVKKLLVIFTLGLILFFPSSSAFAYQMFWANYNTPAIQSAENSAGATVTNIVTTNLGSPYGIAVDPLNQKVYFSNQGYGTIERVNFNGSNREVVVSGVSVNSIDLDLVHNYIFMAGGNQIYRADNSIGAAPTAIVSGTSGAYGMAVDAINNKVYWTDSYGGRVLSSDLNGNGVQIVIPSGLSDPLEIALDVLGNKMFIASLTTIRVANLDGSSLSTLYTLPNGYIQGIAFDPINNMIYWTNVYSSAIKRAPADGLGPIETLFGVPDYPYGIALNSFLPSAVPEPATLLMLGAALFGLFPLRKRLF